MEAKPQLTVTDGFARLSGHDENGCHWIEFTVDYFADETDGECARCGATVSSGWLCLDGADEYCRSCVDVVADTRRL